MRAASLRPSHVLFLVLGSTFLAACARHEQKPQAAASSSSLDDGPRTEATATVAATPAAPSPAATTAPAEAFADKKEESVRSGPGAGSGAAFAARPAAARRAGAVADSLGAAPPSPEPAATGWAMPPQQFAGVKAGEWDDNANYREWKTFLSRSQVGYRRVNLDDRRFLVVRDKNGLGIPRCKVTVSDGRQMRTSFVTTASGRAILFPHAEGLGGDKLTATADCAEGTAQVSFPMIDQDDGAIDLKLQAERRPIGMRTVDVAFVLDTTGSMSEEIAAVKATIQKVASSLSSDQVTVRIGLVEYKDRTDQFVTRVFPFSSDLASFSRRVSQISAGGGGDTPEDMNAGLHTALTQLEWSEKSVARLAFVIADAPPHLDYDGPDYAKDMKTASHKGVQLFTVAASGMDQLGQVVFRQMAQFTGGTNMFVLRGGAGPQSTGGGDPASSCGGTHTNYSSGKLDELIVQKIRRELHALDADPMRIAGLRQDENAKPCDQRIVFRD